MINDDFPVYCENMYSKNVKTNVVLLTKHGHLDCLKLIVWKGFI